MHNNGCGDDWCGGDGCRDEDMMDVWSYDYEEALKILIPSNFCGVRSGVERSEVDRRLNSLHKKFSTAERSQIWSTFNSLQFAEFAELRSLRNSTWSPIVG